MKLLPAVLLACLAFPQRGVAAEPAKDGHWESLFNGKDLSGWVPMYDVTFVVTNHDLRLVTGTGWLRTEKQYADFILEAEWRALAPAYDSGFFVRAAPGRQAVAQRRLAGQPRPQLARRPRAGL